ncbi:MAG: PHP domain-containing protein [Aggregatilineales bacterium]
MSRSYASGIRIAPESFVDLQTHTHHSDGKWTPEALIDYFVREGFATAAITDHDRVDTLADIQRIARERGFPLIVGAEMTTRWRNSVVDILCFGFESNPTPLHELADAIYNNQRDTSLQVYENLVRKGFVPHHDEAELGAILDSTTSKQPHMLFDLFVKHNPHLVDDFAPMQDAGYRLCTNPTSAVVSAVHQSGGVALIGHPGRSDGFALFDADSLDQFRAEIPVDGIEVYYPRHTDEQVEFFKTYATEHNLLISAGSDSHTPDNPPIKYRADQCTALLSRLDIVVT